MDNSFEIEVKDKLKWKLTQWQKEGEKARGMKRLINSIKYWSARLHSAKRNNNVVLTIYQDKLRAYPSLEKIVEELLVLNNEIKIVGYAKFQNKRFLSLTFGSTEERDFVACNLTCMGEAKIAFLHWADEVLMDTVELDWLSDQTDLDLAVEFMEQYMFIQECKRIKLRLANGETCTSGRVEFRGKFKDGITRDDLPHLTSIDGLQCLVVIEGRPLQCFTCSNKGHKAVNCYKAFCKICNCVRRKSHLCTTVNGEVNSMDFTDLHAENVRGLVQGEIMNGADFMESRHEILEESKKKLFQNITLDEVKDAKLIDTDLGKGGEGISNCNQKVRALEKSMEHRSCASQGFIPKDWFDEVVDNLNSESKRNAYITEDVAVGNPNFILVDTSTGESEVDSDMDTFMMMEGEKSSPQLNEYLHVSRAFMDNSSEMWKQDQTEDEVKSLEEMKKLKSNSIVREDKAKLLDKEIEKISTQLLESEQSILQTGCRKKVRDSKSVKSKRKKKR